MWVYAATHGDVVDEETQFDLTAERHIYASSKLAAEMFCADYANLFGRPYTVLRYGIPFGPRMRSDLVVAAFLERALRGEALRIDGDGAQERSFVYVEDLAAAHVLALGAGRREPHLQPRGQRADLDPPARGDDRRARRRHRGDLRPVAAGRLPSASVSAASGRAPSSAGPRSYDFAAGLQRTLDWYRRQMTARGAGSRGAVAGYGGRPPRRIAVVPAYNEEPMVAAVLDKLYPLVDELVVVDDGSTDGTRREIERWLPGHDRCQLLWHDVNQGMSEAYILALTTLRERARRDGELSPNDLVFTVDADGQHDLAVLDELVEITIAEGLDAMLAQRDLSYHGPYKKLGNWVLSGWASLWAGNRLHDVESGYRIFRLGSLAHALDFYTGYKYSETVEVAVVMSRLGYRVRNDHIVPVPGLALAHPAARRRHRPRGDPGRGGARVAARARARRNAFGRDVAGHVAACSVLAVFLAIALDRGTSGVGELLLAMLAALAAGVLVRRVAQPPTLALARPVARRDRRMAGAAAPRRGERDRARRGVHRRRGARRARDPPAAPVRARDRGRDPRVAGGAPRAQRTPGRRCARCDRGRRRRAGQPHAGARRTACARSRSAPRSTLATFGMTAYFGASTVSAQWFGGGVTHGPRNTSEVAITFDDAPNSDTTPRIMQILDAAHVHGTFFVVGQALVREPGHRAVALPARAPRREPFVPPRRWRWLDPRLSRARTGPARVPARDRRCPAWFRPPNGDRTPFMARVVHRHGMRMAMWDVSANTRKHQTTDQIVDRVLSGARGGSIIDLRDGLDGSSAVRPRAARAGTPRDPRRAPSEAPDAGAARRARRAARRTRPAAGTPPERRGGRARSRRPTTYRAGGSPTRRARRRLGGRCSRSTSPTASCCRPTA